MQNYCKICQHYAKSSRIFTNYAHLEQKYKGIAKIYRAHNFLKNYLNYVKVCLMHSATVTETRHICPSLPYRMFVLVAPFFALSLTMSMYEGVVAYSYYTKKGCDPLESGLISNPNQASQEIIVLVMVVTATVRKILSSRGRYCYRQKNPL